MVDGERDIVHHGGRAVSLCETPQFDRRHVPSGWFRLLLLFCQRPISAIPTSRELACAHGRDKHIGNNTAESRYFPMNTGLRFSMKAVRPST
jgi:hypothetical protein